MSFHVVGLEIGLTEIRVVQINKKINAIEILQFHKYPIPPEDDLSLVIKKMLQEHRIRGDLVVVGISSQKAAFRYLSLPFTNINKAYKVMRYEVGPYLPYSSDDTALISQIRSEMGAESSALFVGAVQKETVRSLCQSLNAAGLDPQYIMLDCIALYNLYLHSSSPAPHTSADPSVDPREVIALIDIDEERTLIVVVQGGRLLFCRNISNPVRFCFDHDNSTTARKSMSDEPGDSAGSSPEGGPSLPDGDQSAAVSQESRPGLSQESLDLLIEKIDFTLYSLSSQQVTISVSRVWLTGKIAAQAGVCNYFTKNLGIETRFFHPFEAMGKLEKEQNHFHDQAPGWAVPLGLTLEMKRSKKNQFNLRQEELRYQKRYSQFKGMAAVLGLLLGLAVSLSMANIHYRIGIQREKLSRINEKIHYVFQELFPKGASTEDELLQTRKVLKGEKEKYKVYSVFFQGALTHLEIMKDLNLQVPREIQVELIDLSIDRNQIKIKGIADSFESVDRLKNSLQKLKRYAQTVVESAKVKGTDNKVDFRLNITASDG